jgi:TrmH family RNA methyltransferase
MTRPHVRPASHDSTMSIDSPANPRLRAAASLRDRRERDRTGLTLVDGVRESLRAIRAGIPVDAAFLCPERLGDDAAALERALADVGCSPTRLTPRAFDRLAYGDRADGVVLVVRPVVRMLEDLELPPDALVLVAEDVEKPGNLGAILRTADGAGADAVIAVGGTDLANPNVVRASVGTVFSVPVAAASAPAAIAWLRERGLRIITAVVDAPRLYTDADLTGSVAIVVGSEADGLSAPWRDAGMEGVRLPMLGLADSLNVSVAAAVLAYEARRQRGIAGRA